MIHICLVAPEIHWNTGNVGRTCLALDATLHLVEPLGFSLDDKHLRRAGLDYWPRVRVHTWPDWPSFAAKMPAEPWFFSARSTHSHWDVKYPTDAVLVFGCESAGLPASILNEHTDRTVGIPMHDMRSLNLSTAVAVAAFEVARQTKFRQET